MNQKMQPAQLSYKTFGVRSGVFTTIVHGNLCRLELFIQPDQRFNGCLKFKAYAYEIRGMVTGVNQLHGFVLEAFEHKPIAMLSVHILGDEMFLELDMPEEMRQHESNLSA